MWRKLAESRKKVTIVFPRPPEKPHHKEVVASGKKVTLHIVPFQFVPGHFVLVTLSPGHFVPDHFVPRSLCPLVTLSLGHFVPWSLSPQSFCPLVILSPSHFVPGHFVSGHFVPYIPFIDRTKYKFV
jgi:hypothetical protein